MGPVLNVEADPAIASVAKDMVFEGSESDASSLLENVVDVELDSLGRVFVLDGGSGRVLFISAAGQLLGTFGSQGAGPGEFSQAVETLILVGDSLLYVPDPTQNRVSVFDPNTSSLVREIRLDPNQGYQYKWGTDGEDVFYGGVPGLIALFSGDSASSPALQILDVSGRVIVDGLESPIGREGRLLGPRLGLAFWNEGFVLASGSRKRVDFFDWEGRHQGDFRIGFVGTAVSGRDAAMFRDYVFPTRRPRMSSERAARALDAARQQAQEMLDVAEEYPPFFAILIDDVGRLWFRSPPTGDLLETVEGEVKGLLARKGGLAWHVFSRTGTHSFDIELPAGFELTRVRRDNLVGYRVDEIGVHRIERYTLQLPSY